MICEGLRSYPLEEHFVTTSDGYVLKMERMPRRSAFLYFFHRPDKWRMAGHSLHSANAPWYSKTRHFMTDLLLLDWLVLCIQ